MLDNHRAELGRESEGRAYHYLCAQGLTPLATNYKTKSGEVDIIMRDNDSIVFVEVRAKSSNELGHPLESVTRGKQRKIIRAALHYLQHYHLLNTHFCRFDVIGITGNELTWIKNAFTLDTYS